MLDQDALTAIHLIEGWGWQRPSEIPEDEYTKALEKCAAVLIDDGQSRTTPNARELRLLVEKSNRRLFAFLPGFRRSYAASKPQQREKLLEEALTQCCNRFERRIVSGAVDRREAS